VDWAGVAQSFARTVLVAAPAALAAALLALPVAYLAVRYPSRATRATARLAYLGYALPALPFALAMAFFALHTAPVLYQTLALLVFAYVMMHLALMLGPLDTALLQRGRRQEEVARSLGLSALAAFLRAVLPGLRAPLIAG